MARPRIDKDAVVASAADVADEQGLDEVALAKIADDLGVQSSALYNHVDGLDGLRQDLATESARGLADHLTDAVIARSGADAIEALAGAYRSYALEHPGRFASILLPAGRSFDTAGDANRRIVDVVGRVLVSHDPDATTGDAVAIWSALHGHATLEISGAFDDVDVDVDAAFAALVASLVAGR